MCYFRQCSYTTLFILSGASPSTPTSGGSGRVIPGNVLCSDSRFPFRSLTQFGAGFLKKFHGAASPSPVLDHLVIVDTPGISNASAVAAATAAANSNKKNGLKG